MKFKKPKFWDFKKPNLISYLLFPFTLLISLNNFFLRFKSKKKNKKIKLKLNTILKKNNHVIQSLRKTYKDSFNYKNLSSLNKNFDYRIIGMGGSTLGAQAIYDFLKKKN